MQDFNSQNTNKKNLLQLIYLRIIAIFGQILTIFFVHYFLKISLPIALMMAVIALLSLVNLISFYSYKKKANISNGRLFFELFLDVIAFSGQIYLSGGISNPFISLILLQTTYAYLISAITIICYLWLSRNYQELHAFHHHSQNLFDLHLYGMLLSYIIATILLLIFITKIVKNLKQKDQQALAQEQLIRMGLFATNAAHELGTPLSSALVILNDLKDTPIKEELKKDFIKDIEIIESQIYRCKEIISDIASSFKKPRLEKASKINIKEVFSDLIKKWQNSKDLPNLFYNFSGEEDLEIILDDILIQSFFDILDNAFEASKQWISIRVTATKKIISIEVEDRGGGFEKKILENLGKTNLSTKNSSGLGLFLAFNSLPRINGKLEIKNINQGALAKIIINL